MFWLLHQTKLSMSNIVVMVMYGVKYLAWSCVWCKEVMFNVGMYVGNTVTWNQRRCENEHDVDTGLVEMFGGDRGSSNRHYHNIASLADIHYRSLTLRSGVKKSLIWDEKSVDQIVHKIQSINFDEEPGADEP